MGIIIDIDAGSSTEYELLNEGIVAAVLADIVDLGKRPNMFKMDKDGNPTLQPKLRFVWLTEEKDSNDRHKLAFETFTVSLHEKASLTKRVKSLTGVVPTTGLFNTESLLGSQARLIIEHNVSKTDGKTYANVASLMKPDPKAAKVTIPSDFVRKQDKAAA